METDEKVSAKPKIVRPKPLTVVPQAATQVQEKTDDDGYNYLLEDEPLGIKKPRAPRAPREKKVVTEMDYIQKKILEQPLTVESWVAARIQFPKIFKFTEDGDLDVPAIKAADTRKIIRFEKYIPATSKYTEDFLSRRLQGALEPEKKYTVAKRNLQQLVANYNPNSGEVSLDDILDANDAVKEAECEINSAVKMPRNFTVIEDVKQNELNFDWYDRLKFAEPVLSAEYTTFPVEAFWMPEGKQEVEPSPEVLPTKIDLGDYEDEENDETNVENNQQGGKTNRIVTNQVRGIIGARARMGL
jgi:hypothetical protein